MQYTMTDTDVQLVTPPSGMYLIISSIEGAGSIIVKDTDNTEYPSNPLPQVYAFPINITAVGDVKVIVKNAGNNTAGPVFDSNDSAGHYPGKWGRGTEVGSDSVPPKNHPSN